MLDNNSCINTINWILNNQIQMDKTWNCNFVKLTSKSTLKCGVVWLSEKGDTSSLVIKATPEPTQPFPKIPFLHVSSESSFTVQDSWSTAGMCHILKHFIWSVQLNTHMCYMFYWIPTKAVSEFIHNPSHCAQHATSVGRYWGEKKKKKKPGILSLSASGMWPWDHVHTQLVVWTTGSSTSTNI